MKQLDRALTLVRFLQRERRASFGEIFEELSPISRTTLSRLLAALEQRGEIEHIGRDYVPSRGVWSPGDLQFDDLPARIRRRSRTILERAARESGHACAIFARVGSMTMKIVDQFNLPGGDWHFSPVGYEWPLVPFHGFAKMFLAHSDPDLAHSCYGRWKQHLRPELVPGTWKEFSGQLARIRKKGFALEYQEETSEILRLVVPVWDRPPPALRFVVGLVARNVYLLELEDCLRILLPTAEELEEIFQDL